MSKINQTEAIVFRKRSLLEKDTFITFFSENEGKITAIAKGIKKITSRRAPHIQTGNLVNVILYEKNDRLYLQGSELISAFSAIKSDAVKIDFQYLMLFILDRILPERQKEEDVYVLTKTFIIELAKSQSFNKERMCHYLQKLLILLGYHKKNSTYLELLRHTEEIIHEKIPQSII